jgi:NAD(P)-dependent dehydrogenase (short-subunit alcohol dehydrogenase family)
MSITKSAKDRLISMGGVALVTGASRGIGRATAIRLAADFAAIALVARDPTKLETAAEEARAAGAQTLSVAEDLRQSEAARRVVEAVMSRFGRIDALVNIAGAVPPGRLVRFDRCRLGRSTPTSPRRRRSEVLPRSASARAGRRGTRLRWRCPPVVQGGRCRRSGRNGPRLHKAVGRDRRHNVRS